MILGNPSYWLNDARIESDKLICNHVQYVDHIQKYVSDNKKNLLNRHAASKSGDFQHIGTIPEVLYLKYKHIFEPNGVIDIKAITKWLNTDEGRPYRAADSRV